MIGFDINIVLSRFISVFIIKQIANNTKPITIGTIPPNVNIIPITNPNKHSGKCTGLKKETTRGISIIYCNTFLRPNSQSTDKEMPKIKLEINLILVSLLFFLRFLIDCCSVLCRLSIKEHKPIRNCR